MRERMREGVFSSGFWEILLSEQNIMNDRNVCRGYNKIETHGLLYQEEKNL